MQKEMGGRAFQQQKREAEMSRPTPEDSSKQRKLRIMGDKWDQSGPEGLENGGTCSLEATQQGSVGSSRGHPGLYLQLCFSTTAQQKYQHP